MQVLHRISLHGRSSAELQAFFANIFNTLALHAWCIDRWPVSSELIYPGCPCWRALRYSIAGFDYSLEDILTGILRGRKCSQLHPDPRILCVLALAPSSLPPPTLSAPRLDLDLDRAVRRFCLRHVKSPTPLFYYPLLTIHVSGRRVRQRRFASNFHAMVHRRLCCSWQLRRRCHVVMGFAFLRRSSRRSITQNK